MIDPVAFHVLGRPIYWYGIMVALGFLAAVAHWNALAKREGLPHGIGSDLGFIVMLGGIIGARIAYVVANASYYSAHPAEIIRIDQGGLIFYGGFILSTLGVIGMAWIRKLPLWRLGDFTVSALPLGHALGRVGCFLNGCCYGVPSHVPWSTFTAGAWRQPVQLYESAFNLALYGVLHLVLRRRARPGLVVATYMVGYGLWRFTIEFWRGDEREAAVWGLNVAQVMSLALVLTGAILWIALPRQNKAVA